MRMDRQTVRREKATWSKCFCRLSLMKCQLGLISKSLQIGMYDLIFQNVKNLISTVPQRKLLNSRDSTYVQYFTHFCKYQVSVTLIFFSQQTYCSNHELFFLYLLNWFWSFCQTHSNYSNHELFDLPGKCRIICFANVC